LPDKPEPLFTSISGAARALDVSEWFIKQDLRRGLLRARKMGSLTKIEHESVLERAKSLPKARFAAPKERVASRTSGAGELTLSPSTAPQIEKTPAPWRHRSKSQHHKE
jgi:hypothetical protein